MSDYLQSPVWLHIDGYTTDLAAAFDEDCALVALRIHTNYIGEGAAR